jgi:hypothetical protein
VYRINSCLLVDGVATLVCTALGVQLHTSGFAFILQVWNYMLVTGRELHYLFSIDIVLIVTPTKEIFWHRLKCALKVWAIFEISSAFTGPMAKITLTFSIPLDLSRDIAFIGVCANLSSMAIFLQYSIFYCDKQGIRDSDIWASKSAEWIPGACPSGWNQVQAGSRWSPFNGNSGYHLDQMWVRAAHFIWITYWHLLDSTWVSFGCALRAIYMKTSFKPQPQ